jgi:nucleotide-binding universal stress UspA family protein
MSFRRILVALDASAHSLAALQAASEMAARMESELIGLFVEDINLVRLAGLPFAREVGSAISRQLDVAAMERALKVAAAQAKEAIAATAERVRVPWSFRVTRGSVVAELLSAAPEVDLLALDRVSRQVSNSRRVGSTALSVMAKAPRAVFLLEPGASLKPPLLVLLNESETWPGALSAADELAKACGDGLIVLIAAATMENAQRLQRMAETMLRDRGVQARYRIAASADIPEVVKTARQERAGTIVLAGSCPLIRREDFSELVAEPDVPSSS